MTTRRKAVTPTRLRHEIWVMIDDKGDALENWFATLEEAEVAAADNDVEEHRGPVRFVRVFPFGELP